MYIRSAQNKTIIIINVFKDNRTKQNMNIEDQLAEFFSTPIVYTSWLCRSMYARVFQTPDTCVENALPGVSMRSLVEEQDHLMRRLGIVF